MTRTVLGVFSDVDDAERAVNRLKDKGYNPQDISIVMKDKAEGREMKKNTGADVAGGAVSGLTSGAVLGGLAGLVASTILPGLGTIFIGGPIAAALGLTGVAATTASGAATGAIAGGLLGAITGLGVSQEEAKSYEKRVNDGGILVAVPVSDDGNTAEQVLTEFNADNVKSFANA